MNREIKFNYIFQHEETGCFLEKIFTLEQIEDKNFQHFIVFDLSRYNLIVKRQFTGLKDKNGKEIYEGDIVASLSYSWNKETKKHNILFEKYTEGVVSVGVYTSSSHDMGGGIDTDMVGWLMGEKPLSEGVEVIGNIYENPNLIK